MVTIKQGGFWYAYALQELLDMYDTPKERKV
jgi:hypothetical protein